MSRAIRQNSFGRSFNVDVGVLFKIKDRGQGRGLFRIQENRLGGRVGAGAGGRVCVGGASSGGGAGVLGHALSTFEFGVVEVEFGDFGAGALFGGSTLSVLFTGTAHRELDAREGRVGQN